MADSKNVPATDSRELLLDRVNTLNGQLHMIMAAKQYCTEMKEPLLIERYEKRMERLKAEKTQITKKINDMTSREMLLERVDIINEQLHLNMAAKQSCIEMKRPLVAARHEKRMERLKAVKAQMTKKINDLNSHEMLLDRVNTINEQLHMNMAAKQSCTEMKRPLLAARHEKRMERLKAAKAQIMKKINNLNAK